MGGAGGGQETMETNVPERLSGMHHMHLQDFKIVSVVCEDFCFLNSDCLYFFTSSNHFCWNCNSSELSRPQIMRNSPNSTSLCNHSYVHCLCFATVYIKCHS